MSHGIKLNNEYPGFITRHSGVAFYGSEGKKVIAPADAFFMGRVMVEEPQTLLQMIDSWLQHKKRVENEELRKEKQHYGYDYRWDGGVLGLEEHYMLEVDGQRKKRRLIDMTARQIFDELVRKAKIIDKTSKVVTVGGKAMGVAVFMKGMLQPRIVL